MRKHPNSQSKGPRKYCIPQPDNLRRIEGSFAWIDHRLLRSGYVSVMAHDEQALYLFLVLAADRHGVSFYRKEKICDLLDLDFGQFDVARDRLIDLKLIAFEPYSAVTSNGHYQVLPVTGHAPDFAAETLNQLGLAKPGEGRNRTAQKPFPSDTVADAVAWARS